MRRDPNALDTVPLRHDADRTGATGVPAAAVGGAAAPDPNSLVTVPEETA